MDKLLVTFRDADVYLRDAILFQRGNWLNDSCINYCLRGIEDLLTTGLLMDPAVVSFLKIQCHEDDEFSELYCGLNLENKIWLFLPVNDNESFSCPSTHWSAILLHIPTKRSWHFDSCCQANYESAMGLSRKICRLLYKREEELPLSKPDCPRQSNGSDCGCYVVLLAKYLWENISAGIEVGEIDGVFSQFADITSESTIGEFRKTNLNNLIPH